MDFDKIVENRCRKIKEILQHKAGEYAKDKNRFHNFDLAATMAGTTPEKALKGMMLKHEVSVQDLINNPDKATEALIDEKIGDNINYLILLEGLLRRHKDSGVFASDSPTWVGAVPNQSGQRTL